MAKMKIGSKEKDTPGPFSEKDTNKYLEKQMGKKRDTVITGSSIDQSVANRKFNFNKRMASDKIGKMKDFKATINNKTGKYTYSGTFELK